jgi:hypothetical protein
LIYYKKLCFTFIFFCSFAVAEQSHFSKLDNDDNYQFNYQWQDINAITQSITFPLAKSIIFGQFRNFKTYKIDVAQKFIKKHIKRRLRKNPFPDVRINFNNQDNSIDITGKSELKISDAYTAISDMELEISEKYLKDNLYHRFTTHNQVNAIKPDHRRFANLSVEYLKPIKPVILEKVSIKNIREVTDFTLGFVQSIPYSTLESRITSAGAGFNPPLKLLWENQGDCDSKVTLTAALLRSLMPRINIALIFIDNHALIGVNVASEIGSEEMTIEHNGITYLLAEPTGPVLLTLGTISEDSQQAILQGQYTIETM